MKDLLDELISLQKKKVMALAQEIIPHITEEDLLQPNDFLKLESNPHFRYEEGILQGLFTVKIAHQTLVKESSG